MSDILSYVIIAVVKDGDVLRMHTVTKHDMEVEEEELPDVSTETWLGYAIHKQTMRMKANDR